MAARWSNEHMVAEYKSLQANAMAVDCTGQYTLLAGRRVLALVDLDQPTSSFKKFPRQSKWEVSAVQWNPHQNSAHLFATACNQRADICSWAESSCIPQGSLKAHTRVISDLDWSPKDSDLLATCSVDTYTYVWDIRDYRKPNLSLQAVAGASQVKWNKINPNLLATTHDGDIRIWDHRKGTSPVQYIAGHLSKIHGLDWCPTSEFHLATSSQDCTVKFWDVTSPRQAESKLPSGSPVWRARYTPFGKGLMTVVVPQLRRGENSLFLWSLDDTRQPIHTFVGHTDVVLEFQWRHQDEENEDFQLVTWSKDQSLRIWKIEPQLQKLCGHDVLDEANSPGLSISVPDTDSQKGSTRGAAVKETSSEVPSSVEKNGLESASSAPVTIQGKAVSQNVNDEDIVETPPQSASLKRREEIMSPHQPKTLQQEFSLLNIDIPNVTVDNMDAIKRCVTVSAASGKYMVNLTMTFPENYPINTSPTFQFGKKTAHTLNKAIQTKLIKVLRDTSLQHVKHSRSCIEPCLRQLVKCLEILTSEDRKSPDSDTPYNLQQSSVMQPPNFLPIYSYGSFQDASVPFPRTSGARFCGSGYLICFTRRVDSGPVNRRASSNIDLTPRALSALSAYGHSQSARTPQGAPLSYGFFQMARSPPSDSSVSISNYYNYMDRVGSDSSVSKYGSHSKSPMIMHKSRPRSKSRLNKDRDSGEPRNKESSSASPKKQVKQTGPVIIYNISCLLPINRQLAENYVIDLDDIPGMCQTNAKVAATVGRKDLVQVWSLAAQATSKRLHASSQPDRGTPWACHPFGRSMIKSLIEHYCSIHDVQTLAMLCCAFGGKGERQKSVTPTTPTPQLPSASKLSSEQTIVYNRNKRFLVKTHKSSINLPSMAPPSFDKPPKSPPGGNGQPGEPSSLSPQVDTSLNGWNISVQKIKRSNSWSDLYEDYKFDDQRDPIEMEKEQHEKNLRLLDPSLESLLTPFKAAYSDLLYRWEQLNKRAEVLKYASTTPELHSGIEFINLCSNCHVETRGPQCTTCKRLVFQCAICHIAVKGSSSFCVTCGHGGHSLHMLEWFRSHTVCPTGCGCRCLHDDVTDNDKETQSS